MSIRFSVSGNIRGSHKNAYKVNDTTYCFGKGTTYNFQETQVNTLDEVVTHLLFSAVSPYIYKDGHRHRNTVTGIGNLVFLDIDSKTNIEAEVLRAVASLPFQYVLAPTQNHLTVSPTGTHYKYRLVIPVENLTNALEYKAIIHWLISTYGIPSVDSASWTDARFFAPAIPLVGSRYTHYISEDNIQYAVTQQEVDAIMHRLRLIDTNGNFVLSPEIYPYRTTGQILQYSPDMMQHAPVPTEQESSATITGKELTRVYEDSDNTLNKASLKKFDLNHPVSFGDLSAIMSNSTRVFVQCPTHHLHSTQDTRYAWLLKTGGGDVRLYCSSDTCKAQHGEFRKIILPKWKEFVGERNFARTVTRVEQLMERVVYNLLTSIHELICTYKGVTLQQKHEKMEYAKNVMFEEFIDKNALYVLVLLITKEKGSGPVLIDISLSGGLLGKLNIKTAGLLMTGSWYTYLFKAMWTQFSQYVSSKEVSKVAVFKLVVDTIATDTAFTEVVKESSVLRPSLPYDSSVTVDVGLEGRHIEIVNSSFDEPVYRLKDKLDREGIVTSEKYASTVQAFTEHWKLPHGGVPLGDKLIIKDLPTLLIVFACLNMYTDGVTNQRHTALIITAPPSVGKTSLINNIHEVGLSNSDTHTASVFGYDGLYPQSIENLKNKLWATGDELSPQLMKQDISMPLLLSNLTRRQVNVNIKGKIDSEFTAYAKVLWGARAWEAISQGNQATELRSRLFAITYTEEMFDVADTGTTPFLDICMNDIGTVDHIVQHRLASIYIDVKTSIMNMENNDRVHMFNQFRVALKEKYAGTTEYVTEYDEDSGEVVEVKARAVVSDKERNLISILETLLKYRQGIIDRPNADDNGGALVFNALSRTWGLGDSLGKESKRTLFSEEAMYNLHHSFKTLSGQPKLDAIVIPAPSRLSKRWFDAICDKVYGADSKRSYAIKMTFNYSLLQKWFARYVDDEASIQFYADQLGNSDTATSALSTINKQRMKFKIVSTAFVENYLESIS